MPVIDIHSHFFPETWPDLEKKFGTPNWPWTVSYTHLTLPTIYSV